MPILFAEGLCAAKGFGPRVRKALAFLPSYNLFICAKSFFQSCSEGFAVCFQSDESKFIVTITKDGMLSFKLTNCSGRKANLI